jgi:hypothetical protein
MKNHYLIIIAYMFVAFLFSCKSQGVMHEKPGTELVKAIVSGFDQMDERFFNHEAFQSSRIFLLNELEKREILAERDTLFFIENFTPDYLLYSACLFLNPDLNCFHVEREFDAKGRKILGYFFEETFNRGETNSFIVREILNDNIDGIIKLGEDSYTIPYRMLIITTLEKVGSDYNVQSYVTYGFRMN